MMLVRVDAAGRTASILVALLAVTVLLGCGGQDPAGAPATSATPDGQQPAGVVAIGHSGLTGESSDPDRPYEKALENSWATDESKGQEHLPPTERGAAGNERESVELGHGRRLG